MATENLNKMFGTSPVPDLPFVNLNNVNNERVTNMYDLQNSTDNIQILKSKFPPNVNVLQLHTHRGEVVLQQNLNINGNKRLPEEYIGMPFGPEVKYSVRCACRLCANVIDINSAINIFPTNEFHENLSFKINKYLPIVVFESDPFPKTACRSCVTKLDQFHELVEKCIIVEEQFRQTYEFDGRYVDELTKKIHQRSDLNLLKSESGNTESLSSVPDLQYLECFSVNNVSNNLCKQNYEVKENSLNNTLEVDKTKEVFFMNDKKKEFSSESVTCKICERTIKGTSSCLQHSVTYADPKSVDSPCLLGNSYFVEKDDLDTHIKSHFEEIVSESKVSHSPNSRDRSKVRQQKLLKQKLKVFNKVMCCKRCKETLDNVDIAVEHCLKHKPVNVKTYPCVLCVRRIGKAKLKDHVSLHYPLVNKPILSCDNCNNLYQDEKTLKYHRCSKLRKYKCSQCKQGFKSEDRLKFHEDFHKNKSTFCNICKKDFKFESRIYLHFAGVHNGIREKPYCCDVCGKTFTWLTVLNSHKRTHTNERPYKCAKCDARFCNKYSLRGHMPSHEDHPQFYCEKCDYHTGRKQNLQKHVNRFHKEINSSQICIRCRICNEIFPNKHHVMVEEHFSKHSREEIDGTLTSLKNSDADGDVSQELEITKLYQCERCERCYMSSDHLAQHRSKHATDDAASFYQCRLCGSGFSKHDLLVRHQKVHINISSQYTSKLSVLTVISCDVCGIECVDYRQLLNHKDRGNCTTKKISGSLGPKKVLIKKHLKPLKTHQLFINSNGLFECPNCQRTYKNRRRYRLHLATHTNNSF